MYKESERLRSSLVWHRLQNRPCSMCPMPLTLIRCIKLILENQQIHYGFVNVILLQSDRRHVSATHMAIFKAVRTRIQIIFYTVTAFA